MLHPFIKLIRPTNWIKNLLIFLPYILSKNINLSENVNNLILGFISFSFMSSVGYILNDVIDIDNDRQHENKKFRPLAYGSVQIKTAIYLAIFLFTISLILSYLINITSFKIIIVYFILNYFYSTKGKTIRFYDIIILSSFYLIRIIYGSIISNVILSGWFVATLIMIVFGIAINKRFMELKISKNITLLGRNYTKDDELILHSLMINFSIAALILLNIHSYFVLLIHDYYFYCIINLITPGIIFYYFDYAKNISDDPVEKIIKNKNLLILTMILLLSYFFEIKFKYLWNP